MNIHAESQPIRIYALGRFEIVLEGQPLRFASKAPRKVLGVLKSLVCAGNRGLSQGSLQNLLWSESDSLLARRALSTSLYRLRQLLRDKEAIALGDGRISLNPALCWVDAWVFEQGICDSAEDPSVLQSILRLYDGTLLRDADYPLAYEARERLRRKFIQAVLQLGQIYERSDEIGLAIALYEGALDIDCTPEDVHRALMRCHAREGKPAAVGAAYQRCRTMLWRYFAANPSPATEQVYHQARSTPTPGFVSRVVSVNRPVASRRSAPGHRSDIACDTDIGGISVIRSKMQG
jgi:DNA-binding SARP family transcriptional activator